MTQLGKEIDFAEPAVIPISTGVAAAWQIQRIFLTAARQAVHIGYGVAVLVHGPEGQGSVVGNVEVDYAVK